MLGGDAHAGANAGIFHQVLVFTVHRHKEPGLGEGEQQAGLILAGVAGDMHIVHPLVDDIGAQLHQLVYHLADAFFIAGDGGGGDDDAVIGADLDIAVAADAHAGQGAHGLALTAGGDEDDLLIGVVLQVIGIDEDAGGNGEVAQLLRDGHDIDHAAAEYRYLAPEPDGGIHHLLDAVHIAGEGGDDDALIGCTLKELFKALAHDALAGGGAGFFGIGAIAEEGQNALAAQFAKADQVDGLAGDGGEIHLEIAGVDDEPRRGTDGKGTGIGYGMVDTDELDAHGGAGRDGIAGLDGIQLALIEDAVLLELAADEPDGKGGGVHRGLDLLEQEGQGADVVLVPMGDEDAADLGRVFLQIGEIRDDQIDTGQVVIREGGAAIHNKDILLGLKDSQVLADLAQAAQGNDPERGAAGAVGLFAAAGAAVGLLRGSGRLFAAALGSGLLFGRLAFGGAFLFSNMLNLPLFACISGQK